MIACGNVMIAAETKPTSITVTIEEDCTSIVETTPVPMPAKRLEVAMAMMRRSD